MPNKMDELVRQQAAILTEIDHLNREQLEFFANLPLPEDGVPEQDSRARKLLRGLVRSFIVGKTYHLNLIGATDKPGVFPASPGWFVVDLIPLPSGGFDRREVMKIPVVAWRVDEWNVATPIIPGVALAGRWAVLMPGGFVMRDEYTYHFCEHPLALRDWIEDEAAWLAHPGSGDPALWTVFARVFQYSGPLARAVWLMMLRRHQWIGEPEELLKLLSDFCDKTSVTNWPRHGASLLTALQDLGPLLADAGIAVAPIDDGRLVITRAWGEGQETETDLLLPWPQR